MNERRGRDGGKKTRERVRWRGKEEGRRADMRAYQDRRGGRDKRMDTAEMKRMEGHDNEIGWRRRKRG